ncbi:DNA-directed RNA polymerase III subunit RPC5-like isoform X2 [Zingiber officinale]|uniref:DNA-directed RNA polymerase III subunit RPC5-like isoform X2 n=1 Tax=Zingiber officinale TaxID=94328 RepID=UPI001C4B266F|nr:DNA-directed RNA polymerase III subunit RPC5-like isoform X2 [Zingiber officinale]
MDGGDDGIDPSAGAASDLDMALDLNLDRGASQRPARSARFQPKMKGKVKIEPPNRVKPDPDTGPPAPDPVKEDPGLGSSSQGPSSSRPDAEVAASCAMDVDGGFEEEVEEEDPVVREIDVFCSPAPLDVDSYLYILQYVLRPSWRPYELNERCEKVRVKPTKSKIEIDLSLDIDSENYDQDVSGPLRLEKQILSSSLTPSLASYAIGILDGNQLHLNPVHAVVQLRPSMTHLNPEMKENAQTAESSTKSDTNAVDSPGLSIKQERFGHASLNKGENDEPWVSLEYHPIDSHLTERYHQKMISEDHRQIPFMMKPSNYADLLYPGTSTNSKTTKVSSLRFLLSLPLEERLKKWLSEVSQVNNFNALMDLAPDNSKEDVLKVLLHYADLVQGLWITKSSLLHEGEAALYRDYLLYLFSMNPIIPTDKLRMINYDGLKSILVPLAIERRILKHWKFKESTDFIFIRNNPEIVDEQEKAWLVRWNNIIKSFGERMHAPTPSGKRAKVVDGARGGKDKPVNTAMSTLSTETLEHLPKILLKIFQDQKIRSMNSVINGLRGLAISNSSRPREDPRTRAIINAATNGASAPVTELQAIVSQIAVDVHGVYILKSSGSSDFHRLRDVVIDLFRGKEPNAKLNKQEIRIAAKTRLQKDITDSDYNQVIRELCDSSKGSWVLKSGDQ